MKPSNSTTESSHHIAFVVQEGITGWLTAVSFLILPLYIKGGYHHLIEDKAILYTFLTVPALIIAAVTALLRILSKASAAQTKAVMSGTAAASTAQAKAVMSGTAAASGGSAAGLARMLQKHASGFLLSGIAVWALISTCLSPDPRSSLLGTIGWSMGSLMICATTAATACIASWYPAEHRSLNQQQRSARKLPAANRRFKKRILPVLFVISHSAILLFALLQAAGVDPFNYLSGLDPYYLYSYLSTIGQKNSFAGYLCLVLPLFCGLFVEAEKTLFSSICGMLCTLGFLCTAIADSDSIYAGLGVCVLFFLPYALSTRRRAGRSAVLLMLFGLCLFLAGQLPVFSYRVSQIRDLSAHMLSLPAAACFFSAGIMLLFFSKMCMEESCLDGKICAAARVLLCVLETAFAAAAVAAVIYTAFHFTDSWGTNRGIIWRTGWEQFLDYPILKKIAGTGPGLLAIPYAGLRVSMGINVVSAHCEPLHVLLTQGIVGLCLYLLLWGRFIFLWIKHSLWHDAGSVWFFSLAAYLGHSMFCPLYPVSAAIFSVTSGLFLQTAEQPAKRKERQQ